MITRHIITRAALVLLAELALTLAVVVLLTACEGHPVPCCLKRDNDAATRCMLACAEAANPKSDEEGEDLVQRCTWDCQELTCSKWRTLYVRQSIDAPGLCVAAGGVP